MMHNSCLYSKILHYFDKFHRQIAEKKAKKIAIAILQSRMLNFATAIVLRSFDQMAIADHSWLGHSVHHQASLCTFFVQVREKVEPQLFDFRDIFIWIWRNVDFQVFCKDSSEVIYPLYFKRASMNQRRIDYLSINGHSERFGSNFLPFECLEVKISKCSRDLKFNHNLALWL